MIVVENNPDLKYRYSVYTWGGFYNEEYQKIHKQVEGLRVFDNLREKTRYIILLRKIEKELDAKYLMMVQDEGFAVATPLTCHRVINLNGKYYYSSDTINVWPTFEDSFSTACYHMEWKWYPGFNDYPAGEELADEEVDYSTAKVVQEWITGAFKPEQK